MGTEEKLGKVAIVVLSYNNSADTLECFSSLENLDGGPYKTLLVDNGSTDGTIIQVRENFPMVEILDLGSNFGVPTGFNKGIIKSLQDGFEYVFILNNDTVTDPSMMTELLKIAEIDRDTALVMPKVCFYPPKSGPLNREDVWSDGGYFRRFPPTIILKDKRKNIDFNSSRKVEYAPACGLLIHRRTFETIGLFDEGFFFFYEDWDFSERLHNTDLNIWVAPDALLWHKVSKTTRKDIILYWRQMGESTARFLKRHFSPSVRFFQKVTLVSRDFFLKPHNLKFLRSYYEGLLAGQKKALDAYPSLESSQYSDPSDND